MRNYTIKFALECNKNTSQYFTEHLKIFLFIERFGNFQISLRSHELISVTRFPIKSAVSVKWTYLERRQKFGYWNSYATELFSASSGHWPCLSFVDRFLANLSILRARRVAITYNKSFAMLPLEKARLSFHAFILLSLYDVVGAVVSIAFIILRIITSHRYMARFHV